MLKALQTLDERFAFQTSGRFDLLAGDHVPYRDLGAPDIDGALRRSIERGKGVITVLGRMGSGKSSLIAAVADALDEGFVPLRVSVIGVEAGDLAAFARHAIAEIRDLPDTALTRHETQALARPAAEHTSTGRTRELRAGFQVAAGHVLSGGVLHAPERLHTHARPADRGACAATPSRSNGSAPNHSATENRSRRGRRGARGCA
ncbi:MAG: hypothetical protein ACYCUM_14715 [Solirubrobacteraceae bacterium]